jgi:hypothetical protein
MSPTHTHEQYDIWLKPYISLTVLNYISLKGIECMRTVIYNDYIVGLNSLYKNPNSFGGSNMRKIITNYLVGLLIVALIASAVLPAIGERSSSAAIEDTTKPVESEINTNTPQCNAEKYPSDSSDTSFSQTTTGLKNSKFNKIVVATTNVNELAILLSDYEYRGFIGSSSSNSRGIAFPIIEVPHEALTKIENLPSVLGVYDYVEPVTDKIDLNDYLTMIKDDTTIMDSESVETDIYTGSDHHGAETAWANSYTGNGVKIATASSGTDFGQYELSGRHAVVTEEDVVTNDILIPGNTPTSTSSIRVNIPEYYKVISNTFQIYRNATLMTSGYILTANGTLEFSPPIPPQTLVNASYVYRSPYYHYPIAFDSTSMSNYLATGLPSGTETPKDMWYANTSSTDMHIYHSIVLDGTNDFWDEINIRGCSNSTYQTSQTSELKGRDESSDMKLKDLDLTSLYTTSDDTNWYVGFNVSAEIDTDTVKWKREFDLNYGLYIDADGVVNSGASVDPLGNYINTTDNRRPEYVIYLHHTSYDWGIIGSVIKWEANQTGIWKAYKTFVNWGANSTAGYWSKNRTVEIDYEGDISDVKVDLQSWSKNNTLKNATFHAWSGTGWNNYLFVNNIPLNTSVGIGPKFGSEITQYNGTLQLKHNGVFYPIQSSSTYPYYVYYNNVNVSLDMIYGKQAYVKDFIEFLIPRNMVGNLTSFYMTLFTVGNDRSHAQDTSPLNANVSYEHLNLSADYTTLDNFAFVDAPQQYVTTGIPTVSGNYHVGLHPDQNFLKGHYGRPVAVLLTDYYEAGLYDTVYVDLDNDKNFSDERPVQEYGAYNDTLNFGPRYGTVRCQNGTILHGGQFYDLYNIVENEALIIDREMGEENITFRLAHGNSTGGQILGDVIIQKNLVNLTETIDYTLYRNNGTIILNTPLNVGDNLIVLIYRYKLSPWEPLDMRYPVDKAYINHSTLGEIQLEFRDWIANKDLDADKGKENFVFDDGIGDGKSYPDVSGGMVYFIADNATPLPYSDIFTDRSGAIEDNRIPTNGELVAFFGEFDADSFRGTQISSAINAGGIGLDGNNNSIVKGMAPNAKLIPIRGASPFDSWYFSVEGYDGKIDTTDDAQIVVISTNYPVQESGWDIYTKAADYIGTYYAKGKVVFVSATGDTGFGYGTVGSPSSANAVITVGEGTMFDYRCYNPKAPAPLTSRKYADGGISPRHADIIPASGRGPNMLGNPVPDAITIGAFQFGSIPLNVDQDYTTPSDFEWYGGQWAWDLWSGAAASAANTGGMLATIYEAYYNADHQVNNEVVLHATRNTTTVTLSHTPVITGTITVWRNGGVVTDYTIDLSTGVITFTSNVITGDWINASYRFRNEYPDVEVARALLKSGADNMNYDTLVQGAGFVNADRSTKLAANLDGLLIDKSYWVPGDYRGTRYESFVKLMDPGESASETFTIENKNTLQSENIGIYDAIFQRFGSLQMPLNITKTYDDKNIPGVINIEPYIAVGTELLKVTITSPRKPTMQNYMGELFDWTDENADSILEFPGEQNRMTYCTGTNHLELRYRDPLGRIHNGLVVQVKSFGGTGETLTDWTITLEFYEKVDWSWLQVQTPPTTIAAGASTTFTANLIIPANASIGSYEGAIYIKQDEPVEPIASGVGQMFYNQTFSTWLSMDEARLGEINLTSGTKVIVPKTTIIRWNGTTLIEGIDYALSGISGNVKFFKIIPDGDRIYYEMEYLTVAADGNGNPIEEAVWSGTTTIPNFVKGSLSVNKNDVAWNETEVISNENVIVSLGGEKTAALKNGNVVRETIELNKDGSLWSQFGGTQSETFTTVAGQNATTLAHGNIVMGSTQMFINNSELPQSIEITSTNKEDVQGLNTTSQSRIENLTVNPVTWDGKLSINGDDTPNMKVITYLIYEDGIALIDGLQFNMHVDGTHGKFRLTHDPAGHAYNVTFSYYNSTQIAGRLAHGNIVSESYKLYKNGIALKDSEYQIDLITGNITLVGEALKANEAITASYQYNTFILGIKFGTIQFTDAFTGGQNLTIVYNYYNYTIELARGIITFADLLPPGVTITANYSYARYTLNMEDGVIMFARPLLPGEFINCSYSHYCSVIPVFCNIGADKPSFTFGGGSEGLGLFNNNEIIGGFGAGSGDKKFYYLDIREQGIYENPSDNERLYVDVQWENALTDVDVHVFGGRKVIPAVSGNSLPSEEYGPHTVEFIGGSDTTTSFFTTTGGAEEIVAPRISGGINVIELNNVGMNGTTDNKETFSAKVGTMYVDPTEVKYVTNKLYGKQTISMHSNTEWSGVGGIAGGPSAPEQLRNSTVTQDDPDWSHFDTFEDQLASGKTVIKRAIENCLIFDVHIWGQTDFGYKDVVDLDLGVFKDGSGADTTLDGKVQSDEFYAMCADFDADEEVKLIAPPDGTYLIVVYGFDLVTDPAHYDMDITIVQGTGFGLSGKGDNSLPVEQKGYFSSNQTEDPYNLTHLTVSWDLPGSTTGTMQGALYVGPGNGPMCMLIPIELVIDTTPPIVKKESIFPLQSAVTNTNTPLISAEVEDTEREEIDQDTVKLFVDDIDVTSLSKVTVTLDEDSAKGGYPRGSVQYTPSIPLSEGSHSAEIVAFDLAGNEVRSKWAFTVDTRRPDLDIGMDSRTYTNQDRIQVHGSSAPDSEIEVKVGAITAEIRRDPVGGFTANIDLVDGDNLVTIIATDSAGNQAKKVLTVIQDTESPTFERLICLDGTLTNQANSVLSGSMSEVGTLSINGDPATVNSDGTFDKYVELSEGMNSFGLTFTDQADNNASRWLNVTLDTQSPMIEIADHETTVKTQDFNLTGSTESSATLKVNGKLVQVDTNGNFNKLLQLSPGTNTVVVESKDAAGNVNQIYLTMNYDTTGTNYGAICLMVVLIIIGLIIGLLIARFILGPPAEKPEVEEEEKPEVEVKPEEEEGLEEEEKPEVSEVPPAPKDEAKPLKLSKTAPAAEPAKTEDMTSEEIAEEIEAEETVDEALSQKKPPTVEEEVIVEDEKVVRLKKAFEEGKISKELYEKNLKRLQGKK